MTQENSNNKSVQFSRFIKISFTYPGDEYDRTALEPAKLTFSEATELMQLRIDWKQEMNRRIEQQRQQQVLQDQQDSEDGYSSDEAQVPGLSSPTPSRSSCASSPTLSHQSLSSSSNSSCSSPSSEDEYDQGHRQSFNGSSGMMHRHSHLQCKENMPCLA
ncbi:hypothetical protein BGX27_009122 [Mortierella sp. AM989]|nr:hypothetical protein BGX27_009122 [Mortierella sp. AM989]